MKIVTQVLVLKDHRNEWTPHTLELLTDAAKLARRLEGHVAGWSLSETATDHTEIEMAALGEYGCHVVQQLIHERFANWQSETMAFALAENVDSSCRVIFLPGTARGEEVAALLAVHLDAVWIPDVISISVTRTGVLECTAVNPGGKLSRVYRNLTSRPVIITMRPGVAEARTAETVTELQVESSKVDLSDVAERTYVEQVVPADPKTIDISVAERIVAGGRGTGGTEGMQLVMLLAESLEASLAASRVAVDFGWATVERQVGQTGKTVRPDLYVACGISGASHHLAGMRDSQHIIAINNDRQAPIHDVAHVSLYGDLNEVIPALSAAIEQRKSNYDTPVTQEET